MLHALRVWSSLHSDADSAQAQGCMSGDFVGVLADEQLQSTSTVNLSPVMFMTVSYDHLNIVPIAVCTA